MARKSKVSGKVKVVVGKGNIIRHSNFYVVCSTQSGNLRTYVTARQLAVIGEVNNITPAHQPQTSQPRGASSFFNCHSKREDSDRKFNGGLAEEITNIENKDSDNRKFNDGLAEEITNIENKDSDDRELNDRLAEEQMNIENKDSGDREFNDGLVEEIMNFENKDARVLKDSFEKGLPLHPGHKAEVKQLKHEKTSTKRTNEYLLNRQAQKI